MGLISKFGDNIIGVSKSLIKKGDKHSPEILVYGGMAIGAVAVFEACKATLKAEEILNEAKDDFSIIEAAAEAKPEKYDQNMQMRDKTIACAKTVGKFAKLYGKSAALFAVSAFCILKGHGILRHRYSDVVAYALGLEQSYKALYNRITDEFSPEAAERFASGIKSVEHEFTETDKDGKVKKKKKQIDLIGSSAELGPYEWIFGPDSNAWCHDNFEYNRMFFEGLWTYANDTLIQKPNNVTSVSDVFAEGHIYNCPRRLYAAGWHMPWDYYRTTCEPYIEKWDIKKVYKDYGEGPVPVLKINFKCDGYIWDEIPDDNELEMVE